MSDNVKNSLRALLSDTVDYAGLFPPSKVTMNVAVRNYAEYLKSEHSWMLGRFIVPIDSLSNFSKEFKGVYQSGDAPWRISVIVSTDISENLSRIIRFNEKNKGKAIIDTTEIRIDSADMLSQIARSLPENLLCYFEIPSSIILTDLITAIAISKTRAKIRTGGITQDAFPPVDEIVKFMRICIAANIPFKATAGLHHPLRCIKPLTYEENAPKGTMNGFLALFLTAAFLRQNLNHKFIHELMNETTAENFTFEEESISWKDRTVTTQEIELARRRCAISFGSCSFQEPVEDLQQLNLL